MPRDERMRRIGAVVGGVVGAAVREAGATGVVIVQDGTPESELARAWCEAALGPGGVVTVAASEADPLESALQRALTAGAPREVAGAEARRALGRAVAATRGALVAGSTNKTALLLTPAAPPEPLLPLGDLWASQVAVLAGGWSGPPAVVELAEACGGIERLDEALARWADRREAMPSAFRDLDSQAKSALREALRRARFARRSVGLVPKLGARTLGIDLFA